MRVTMIGTGYVGLVSGACFADFGHTVTCVDKDAGKIARLQKGEIPIFEPGLDELVKDNVDQGRLFFPNVRRSAGRQEDGAIRAGNRPAILDELLRVFSVARLAAREPDVDIRRFQDVLWAGRVRFVSSLQLEMGKALRETPRDRQGADFDPDPRNW